MFTLKNLAVVGGTKAEFYFIILTEISFCGADFV